MSVLTPASKKALQNLRAFIPPPTNYYRCPLKRRAAVLILLFADKRGDLRVVLTIRSSALKNYAGQAALPGGKADTLHETPFQTARREAFEEIGLPQNDTELPPGYTVEHLTELPSNLAMTELGVRPCVAFLRTPAPSPQHGLNPDATRDILPKLDPREVEAVFTANFMNFLYERDLDVDTTKEGEDKDKKKRRSGEEVKDEGVWYKGSWHSWHESAWRMHQFFVPVRKGEVWLASKKPERYTAARDPNEKKPGGAMQKKKEEEEEEETGKKENDANTTTTDMKRNTSNGTLQPPLPPKFYENPKMMMMPRKVERYRVFGMTARILVDAARVAYGQEPEYEHNSHFGDEEMIAKLMSIGRLSAVKKEGEVLTREVMREAGRAKI